MPYSGPTSGLLNVIPLTTGTTSTGPTVDLGSDGEYCLDLNTSILYGPKDGSNILYPWPIASRLWQGIIWRGSWGYPNTYKPGDVVVDAGYQYLCIKPIGILPFTPTTNPGPYYAGDFISDGGLYFCIADTPNKPSVSTTGWLSYSPSQDYLYQAFGYNVAGNWALLGGYTENPPTIQVDNGVTSGGLTWFRVNDASIQTTHLANDSVTAVKLSGIAGSEAVTTGRIRANAVTDAKLSLTGVSAGTYPKVTVNTAGRVTAGASLTSSDMPMPLTLTPAANSTTAFVVNNAGATIPVLTVDTTNTSTVTRQNFTVQSVIDTVNHMAIKKVDGTSVFAVDASPARATVTGESVLNGGFTTAYRGISAARTLDATDHVINCTANTFTVTLPTAVGVTGRTYVIKNSGTGTITVACNGAQTIDGAATKSLATQYSSIRVVSNGANWIVA